MTIERIALPGVGVCHAITTGARQRLGVINRRHGRRDLVVYDQDDPERAACTVSLADHEAHQLADLLAGTVFVDHVRELELQTAGLTAVRIRIPAGSAADGHSLRDLQPGGFSGAAVVAVIRDGTLVPAPDHGFALRHDDIAVAVGDEYGIAVLTALIAGSRISAPGR
ncbi:cation:proton antiporter regulatory subunit [Paractinoplanes rishiriensis]|uniref:Potassium transporter TrkA n=1 Tax=Paractinoplanes rishiriensis TaxID=1050105 RepID=A0A919JY22_9ACTN|nr:cation:proton antiporter regulatory subunit [Actinoplanes rishiriensis]GIE95344.1 potassium transporter TrkA [Actinoplanes rishiriensis]